MSNELFWLTLTVIMTGLIWVPYILDRFATRGIMGTFANPMPDSLPPSAWAYRTKNAHANAVENLVVFAPLVLILQDLGISTAATVTACAVFFWARLVHLVVYALGIPVVRTLAFLVGFGAQVVLALAILQGSGATAG
ncbi:MAG: MAPEG family protein [Bauldia sp.]|nr:MAPEG family protein [Bauldia sp.]